MMQRTPASLVLSVFVWMAMASSAWSHAFAPSLLNLKETPDGMVSVAWKVSTDRQAPGSDAVQFEISPACTLATEPRQLHESKAIISYYRLACGANGLAGRTLQLHGLTESRHTIMVRIEQSERPLQAVMLQGADNQLAFRTANGEDVQPSTWHTIRKYIDLGIEHILLGYDHLLFVLCLIMLMWGRLRALIALVTTFTLAHSVTLTIAALDLVTLPSAPVEALIALSIVLLAAELLSKRTKGDAMISQRSLIGVVFLFGLLHGLGFAGALIEIGLPRSDLLWALVSFNVGVEIGQVLFILGTIALVSALRLLPMTFPKTQPIAASLIGITAAFWFAERVVGFWG